jgi:hypothetical protein
MCCDRQNPSDETHALLEPQGHGAGGGQEVRLGPVQMASDFACVTLQLLHSQRADQHEGAVQTRMSPRRQD